MVKNLFLKMTVLSVTGLGAFTPILRAQEGVARPAPAPHQSGYYSQNYYIASPQNNSAPRVNPTYWTKLHCPLHQRDYCDPCSQDQHGIWTPPVVRWVVDPNYYTVAPDYGWSEPGKWPIVRRSPVYNKYTPDVWYGTGRGGQPQGAQAYPVIATPTDTSQLGYYYQTVPQWQPNPGMIPPPPNPRTMMYRPYELGADGSYTRWVPLRNAWVPINQIPTSYAPTSMPQPQPVIQAPAPVVQPEAVPMPKAEQPPVPPPPPAVPAPEASNEPEPGGSAIRKASFIQRVFSRK